MRALSASTIRASVSLTDPPPSGPAPAASPGAAATPAADDAPAKAPLKPDSTIRALIDLWPFMWPGDRPDLKRRGAAPPPRPPPPGRGPGCTGAARRKPCPAASSETASSTFVLPAPFGPASTTGLRSSVSTSLS